MTFYEETCQSGYTRHKVKNTESLCDSIPPNQGLTGPYCATQVDKLTKQLTKASRANQKLEEEIEEKKEKVQDKERKLKDEIKKKEDALKKIETLKKNLTDQESLLEAAKVEITKLKEEIERLRRMPGRKCLVLFMNVTLMKADDLISCTLYHGATKKMSLPKTGMF